MKCRRTRKKIVLSHQFITVEAHLNVYKNFKLSARAFVLKYSVYLKPQSLIADFHFFCLRTNSQLKYFFFLFWGEWFVYICLYDYIYFAYAFTKYFVWHKKKLSPIFIFFFFCAREIRINVSNTYIYTTQRKYISKHTLCITQLAARWK